MPADSQKAQKRPQTSAPPGSSGGTGQPEHGLIGRQYCTFRLGDIVIGIDVRKVQEVQRHDRMTPVPLSPPEVVGLINLRGQIVTAVDLRPQLGLPTEIELKASVVVRTAGETISLLVQEVGDVVEPSPLDYETVPAAVPARVREVVTGTFKLEGMLLLVLDPDRVVARLETAASPSRGVLSRA
ncbi:MAG TPA: chemotaxis protein CheW [Acidimicrobiales bacterium]|nr:chemotaxis protein CheW [Acidimicrobiales bacterium]